MAATRQRGQRNFHRLDSLIRAVIDRCRGMLQLSTASLMTLLVIAGCTDKTDVPPRPTPNASPAAERSTRWIASPALNLMSPEGTFVRAFVESMDAATGSAEHRGTDAFLNDGYPGFLHAFNNVLSTETYGGNEPDLGRWGAGTYYYEVVDLRHEGTNITAGICKYISMLAWRPGGGDMYRSAGSAAFGQGRWLTFGPDPAISADQQRSPKVEQRGPATKPNDNVFGTWIATKFDYAGWAIPQCKRLAPGTPPDWPDPFVRPDPPPTLPPDPGWPGQPDV